MIVKPSAESLAQAAMAASKAGPGGRGLPPVDRWNPPFCGDIDMRIARDGTWFYLGTPIGRPALVRLFSTILKREGDAYFLVTPVEKVGIRVDDAPFVAVDFTVQGTGQGQSLTFTTQTGDEAAAGPDHPLRVTYAPDGEPAPYVHIRRNLEALIDRKSFYRMIDLCSHHNHQGQDWFGLWSGGQFFAVMPSADLA
jgi:uncharacterized protein